jgi:hypothetical protein
MVKRLKVVRMKGFGGAERNVVAGVVLPRRGVKSRIGRHPAGLGLSRSASLLSLS